MCAAFLFGILSKSTSSLAHDVNCLLFAPFFIMGWWSNHQHGAGILFLFLPWLKANGPMLLIWKTASLKTEQIRFQEKRGVQSCQLESRRSTRLQSGCPFHFEVEYGDMVIDNLSSWGRKSPVRSWFLYWGGVGNTSVMSEIPLKIRSRLVIS